MIASSTGTSFEDKRWPASLTSSVPLEVAQGRRLRASSPAPGCFSPAREAVSPANIFLPAEAGGGGAFELRRCGAPPGVVGRGARGQEGGRLPFRELQTLSFPRPEVSKSARHQVGDRGGASPVDPGRVPASGAYGEGHGRRPLRQKLVACKVLVSTGGGLRGGARPESREGQAVQPRAPADARRGFRV